MAFNLHFKLVVLAALFFLGAWETLATARTLETTSLFLRHQRWMTLHGRTYKDEAEKEKRFYIFKENVKFIEDFNKAGNRSYKLGCCWAFAVVAAVEGLTKIKTGQLISLSEQQLLDCDLTSDGCGGGIRTEAFQFIKDHGGLVTESDYPYEGAQETCNAQNLGTRAATISGYQEVAPTESALLAAVTNQPVSVGITIGGDVFQHYKTGVFTGDEGDCGSGYRHAVTIIGYGTSDDGEDYWLVKNSWGNSWGESGYMKMARGINEDGVCQVNTRASYPTA
nr:ervatamin-B-like [Ipomoea trifida]